MSILRKGSRLITVDHQPYRWLVRPGNGWELSLRIESADGQGQLLLLKLNPDMVVTPELVKAIIRYVLTQDLTQDLTQQWRPHQSGSDIVLRFYGAIANPQQDLQAVPQAMGTEHLSLCEWNPSPALLRRWAYDQQLSLDGCDEALVLHQPEYLPILIPLADDPQCPKADYILMCLAHYLRWSLLRPAGWKVEEWVEAAIALCASCTSQPLQNWMQELRQQWHYFQGIGPVHQVEQAQAIAEALLNGTDRQSAIRLVSETREQFAFAYVSEASTGDKTARLLIDRRTGQFTYHSQH